MTPDDIISAAQAKVGLASPIEPLYREGLQLLLQDYEQVSNLTPAGLERNRATLIQSLTVYMQVESWLERRPDLLERSVDKPMFVFGLPRTGTTLTINLLNCDPSRRCFLNWQENDPVPPPYPHELNSGERYQRVQDNLNEALKYIPHIAAMHHEDADSPAECQFLMSPTFCSQVFESMTYVPSYREWFLHQADYLPAFRFHKRYLQVLQANAPGRWALKNPWHPLYLPALTTVYPDAQLVMTHRDPVDVVGSACSLVRAVRALQSFDVDAEELGQQTLDTFDEMIDRQDAYRAEHGQDAILDIQYDEQIRDPIGQMRRLYSHFGEVLSGEAEQAMADYLARNPKGKHGQHKYSLEDFGLTRDQVRRRFSDYVERYRIPVRD